MKDRGGRNPKDVTRAQAHSRFAGFILHPAFVQNYVKAACWDPLHESRIPPELEEIYSKLFGLKPRFLYISSRTGVASIAHTEVTLSN